MAFKVVQIPDIGTVRLYKRRDARAIKLTVGAANSLRVTLPYWTSYQTALTFVDTQRDWINEHLTPQMILKPGALIGKAHRLQFEQSKTGKVSTRLQDQLIKVYLPEQVDFSSPKAQAAARQGSIKALRSQAEQLLPIRLKQLAKQHSFDYRSVQVKNLRSRWGSCSQRGDITLNLYLMTLPWELIDYVILHELVHTKHPHHGKGFWQEFSRCQPTAKKLRTQLRHYQAHL